MANKASFTPEEWKQLLESPMLASIAVTAAEPSGLWGMLKESFAAGGALAKAKTDAATNELIKAVVADFESAEGRGAARDGLQARLKGSKPGEAKDKAIAGLRQVAALLDAKAPADAAAFKSWLQSISPAHRRGRQGRRLSRLRRRPGQRRREGDARPRSRAR